MRKGGAARGAPPANANEIIKELEDRLIGTQEQNRRLKEGQKKKEEELQRIQSSFGKVQAMVRAAEGRSQRPLSELRSGPSDDPENVPAAVLGVRDRAVDSFIRSLQDRVTLLKKQNSGLQEANSKLRQKAQPRTRGALPRYLQRRPLPASPDAAAGHRPAEEPAADRGRQPQPPQRDAEAGARVEVSTSFTQTGPLTAPLRKGDRVRVRDRDTEPWQAGQVCDFRGGKPLVITDGGSRAFTWEQVERPPEQAPAAEAQHGPRTPLTGRGSPRSAGRRVPSATRKPQRGDAAPAAASPQRRAPAAEVSVHAPLGHAEGRPPAAAPGSPGPAAGGGLLPPPSAAPLRIEHIARPPSARPPPTLSEAGAQTPGVDALVARYVREYAACSVEALSEKTQVVKHMEDLIRALQGRLEESEGTITALRDDLITARVERDASVKSRDLAYRERDMLVDERDYAVRAKAKAEADVKSLQQDVENLQRDRRRLSDERDELLDRHREERGRWETDDRQRLGTLDGLQLALKEKSAAVVLLDQRCTQAEQQLQALKHTNADMLQQLEGLNSDLRRERVRCLELQNDCDVLRLQAEGIGEVEAVTQRLREEKQMLEQSNAEALQRVLETRNATEAEVRRQCQEEVGRLKHTIAKWEAASKCQFKELAVARGTVEALSREVHAARSELSQQEARAQALGTENELLRQKLRLLFPDGEHGALSGVELEQVMAALEVVKRAEDVRDVKKMVDEYTAGDAAHVDQVLDLQGQLAAARHQLELGRKTQDQLRRRADDAEREAQRLIAAAADRARRAEQGRALDATAHQAELRRQHDRLDALRRVRVPSADDSGAAPSTLSLDSPVSEGENILEVHIGSLQLFGDGEEQVLGGSAPDNPPGLFVALDFWVFESCATRVLATTAPDFDSALVFRISLTEDLHRYMQHEPAALQLRASAGGGPSRLVAVGLLRLAPLLRRPAALQLQAPVSLAAPADTATPLGFVSVRLRLKRPLPDPWLVGAAVPQGALDGRLPMPGSEDGELSTLPEDSAVGAPGETEAALATLRGAGVSAVAVTAGELRLQAPRRASVLLTLFPGAEVWLAPAGAEPTLTPDVAARHTLPCNPGAPAVQRWLRLGSVTAALFDDESASDRASTASTAPGADCLGLGQLAVRGLLGGPQGVAGGAVTVLSRQGDPVGTLRLDLAWVLGGDPPAPALPPGSQSGAAAPPPPAAGAGAAAPPPPTAVVPPQAQAPAEPSAPAPGAAAAPAATTTAPAGAPASAPAAPAGTPAAAAAAPAAAPGAGAAPPAADLSLDAEFALAELSGGT
eukprot:TRINITY_DN813_c0_g3_i1.p1 TRINITY_DN813_c0_g3~~TRINITY_DN813_c0_g3_i1.p1  ORF type:complete len:1309 (+),score=392.98 TRINITY_DN813_c0_g3_i1:71-3997(+)